MKTLRRLQRGLLGCGGRFLAAGLVVLGASYAQANLIYQFVGDPDPDYNYSLKFELADDALAGGFAVISDTSSILAIQAYDPSGVLPSITDPSELDRVWLVLGDTTVYPWAESVMSAEFTPVSGATWVGSTNSVGVSWNWAQHGTWKVSHTGDSVPDAALTWPLLVMGVSGAAALRRFVARS
jgi:hypothetical protein